MDAADEDDEEEVGDVAALLTLPPVVQVEGEADEVAQGAEDENGRDEEGARERKRVNGHAAEFRGLGREDLVCQGAELSLGR